MPGMCSSCFGGATNVYAIDEGKQTVHTGPKQATDSVKESMSSYSSMEDISSASGSEVATRDIAAGGIVRENVRYGQGESTPAYIVEVNRRTRGKLHVFLLSFSPYLPAEEGGAVEMVEWVEEVSVSDQSATQMVEVIEEDVDEAVDYQRYVSETADFEESFSVLGLTTGLRRGADLVSGEVEVEEYELVGNERGGLRGAARLGEDGIYDYAEPIVLRGGPVQGQGSGRVLRSQTKNLSDWPGETSA